jgi:DNA-binding CsgD family transcriptional regulator
MRRRRRRTGTRRPAAGCFRSPQTGASQLSLTKREREVVGLIALGRATSEIAKVLNISPETVRTYVRNAMTKLGAHTRAQLVALVLSNERAVHASRGQA